jgi:hypothetical protein
LFLDLGDATVGFNPGGKFQMMKAMTLTMCLILPMSAFATEPAPLPEAPAAAPAADQPTNPSLTPTDAAPNGATEGTRSCGMYGGCAGRKHGAGKFIIITGVVGTVLTAAAVGIAVGVSRQNAMNNGQVPR